MISRIIIRTKQTHGGNQKYDQHHKMRRNIRKIHLIPSKLVQGNPQGENITDFQPTIKFKNS